VSFFWNSTYPKVKTVPAEKTVNMYHNSSSVAKIVMLNMSIGGVIEVETIEEAKQSLTALWKEQYRNSFVNDADLPFELDVAIESLGFRNTS